MFFSSLGTKLAVSASSQANTRCRGSLLFHGPVSLRSPTVLVFTLNNKTKICFLTKHHAGFYTCRSFPFFYISSCKLPFLITVLLNKSTLTFEMPKAIITAVTSRHTIKISAPNQRPKRNCRSIVKKLALLNRILPSWQLLGDTLHTIGMHT